LSDNDLARNQADNKTERFFSSFYVPQKFWGASQFFIR
jgi:hypothetical protein